MEKKDKAVNTELREKLFYERKNGYDRVDAATVAAANEYCEGYKRFLDAGKTEREAIEAAVALAEAKGYVPFKPGMALKPGTKVYQIKHGKLGFFAQIGKAPLSEGANFTASHVDSPRIDLKPVPLYEDGELAMLKTHYYGGLRKYQWVTLPLELRGVVAKCDGEVVRVALGSEADDPVLVITDLLPHLAKDQGTKPLNTAYTGENLNPIIGSAPYDDGGTDRIKFTVLSLLHDRYGFTEADLQSAELSLVPVGTARDVGIDRSLVGAYGQDDRVCAYTTLTALLDLEEVPEKTCVCVLADKEEIGSEGVTGMQCDSFDAFVGTLCAAQGVALADCFDRSFCLSADVSAAYDPSFPDVYEKRNSALVNGGVAVCKYTGSGGKGGASDANAETVAKLRRALDENKVLWQTCELGKVDQGGGGTVCKFMAKRGIESIDAGTGVLSMHAPFEVTAKLDVYSTYLASKAVYGLK